jgi:hypothetical protein
MAYEQRDNSGSMFKNTRKDSDRHADMTGSIMVDGQEYWVNAWRKVDKNNNPWYSFSLKKKEPRQGGGNPPSPRTVSDDEIPFD